MKNLLPICVFLISVYQGFTEDTSSIHDVQTHSQLLNRPRRYLWYKCPEHMLLDGASLRSDENTWRCQCIHGHLYVPSKMDCFLPYRRGPCPHGKYLNYVINETMAQCVTNPCVEDDFAPYNGTCHKIGVWGEGPCNFGALVTDSKTLQPKCIDELTSTLCLKEQIRCPDKQLLDAHSQDVSGWKCVCQQEGQVYFPSEHKCYGLYLRGPCPPEHYVYMAVNETVPQCVANPCSKDRLVPYNGSCQPLAIWGQGPCEIGALVVHPWNHQLICYNEAPYPESTVLRQIYCPGNTRLDQETRDPKNWKCRCLWYTDAYVPSSNDCHRVYRQGPCPLGHHINFAINETTPKCLRNPCFEDGMVRYNGSCHRLGLWGKGPCDIGALVVEPHTFKLKCIGEIGSYLEVMDQLNCPDNKILNYNVFSRDLSTWKCECQSGHVYVPSEKRCYQLFRQGPCPSGQYVHSASNGAIPECMENPCSRDGMVSYNGNCHKYAKWGEGPCNFGGLIADPATFQLKCFEDITDTHAVKELMECSGNSRQFDNWSNDPSNWKCQCSEGGNHLYFPLYNDCYEVYKQGPCPPGYYVYRAVNETVPQCILNPCTEDDLVFYNGTCNKINEVGGSSCGEKSYLTIMNSELVCVRLPLESVRVSLPDSECLPITTKNPNSACMTIKKE